FFHVTVRVVLRTKNSVELDARRTLCPVLAAGQVMSALPPKSGHRLRHAPAPNRKPPSQARGEGTIFWDFPCPRSRTSHRASLEPVSVFDVMGRPHELQDGSNPRCMARWRSDWRATDCGAVLRSIR